MSDILVNQLYKAGAGAGKTTTLIRLIEEHARAYKKDHGTWPHFVVTTFTRKATQELKERLLTEAMKANDFEYLQFVSSAHHVLISTIHGVLNIFLNRHGHNYGFDPSLKILNPTDEKKIEFRVVKGLLKEHPELEDLIELFGLGKTVQLLHDASICLDQFGELKAFDETELVGLRDKKLKAFSSDASRLLGDLQQQTDKEAWLLYAKKLLDITQVFKLGDFDAAKSLFETARKPSFTDKSPVSAITNGELEDLKKDVGLLFKSEAYSPELWKAHLAITNTFLKLSGLFKSQVHDAKRSRGLISMSDLELRTLNMIRSDPEPAVTFSKEWDYWFIDEYQDTSPVQEEIIQQLRGERAEFVVGDPQQSIYLFRGSRSEVFHRKEQDFRDQGHQVHELASNYRSRAELVHFFNDYFRSLKFGSMKAEKKWDSKVAPITFLKTADADAEYKGVSNWIKNLLTQGVLPQDICVLSKKNDLLKAVADVLKKDGIPIRLHTSGGFGRRREVQDALSLLKFLVNPHDSLNLLELLRAPYLHILDSELEAFRSQGNNLWKALSTSDHPVAVKLRELRENARTKGISFAFSDGLMKHGFFDGANAADESGVRESNLFKLLDSLQEAQRKIGFSFLSFIDEINEDNLETSESDAIPAIEPNRVNLMTIHRSKGLQFSHVIVPGFSRAASPARWKPLLVNEELQRVVLSIPNEEGKNESIFVGKDITQEFYRREAEESLRLLYVAFTRAKESLFVSSGLEPERGSWLETGPLDLEIGEHTADHYTYGVVTEVPLMAAAPSTFIEKKQTKLVAFKDKKLYRHLSVTQILEDPKQKTKPFRQILKAVDKIRAGIELHNILELLSYGYSERDEKLLVGKVAAPFRKAVEYVFNQNKIPVREILKNGQAEFGFVYRLGRTRLEGKIDLWGECDDGVWVVDYKSGSSDNYNKAMEQLQLYALPLAEITQKTKLKLAVIFPMEEKVFVEDFVVTEGFKTEMQARIEKLP